MYHGIPADRAELRQTVMRPPADVEEDDDDNENDDGGDYDRPTKKTKGQVGRRKSGAKYNTSSRNKRPLTQPKDKFPVVVTTYEIIIKDRVHLAKYNWGYIVVDEGHRLKNLNCKLMQEIKKYSSAGRMILTGTPLHVCSVLFCL